MPAGRQTAGDADRRETRERPHLDRLGGADEAGEEREQRALVGADLHAGTRPSAAVRAASAVSTSSAWVVRSAMYAESSGERMSAR